MTQLQLFAARALRRLPASLWWVLGLLVGAIFSVRLEKELFPHTPAVVQVAGVLWKLCAAVLPVLGLVWLWRVAWLVEHPGWRLLWYMGAAVASVAAGLLGLLIVVVAVLA
jgi:hypothetical protein